MNQRLIQTSEPHPSSFSKQGLTDIFHRAHERALSTSTSWADPERSIGRYIETFKKEHVWEAIGPARDIFNSIAPDIKDYLETTVEPISSRVIWSLYMIGRKRCSAAPSIIFCCEVTEHRKSVRNIIKNSGILNGFPGIKTGHLPRPPGLKMLVPLAAEDSLQDFGNLLIFTSQSRSACGSQLRITTDGEEEENCSVKATIGGVVLIGDNYYYTTAAHVLQSFSGLLPDYEASSAEEDYRYLDDDDALSLDGSETTTSATSYRQEDSLASIWPGNNGCTASGNMSQSSDESESGLQDLMLHQRGSRGDEEGRVHSSDCVPGRSELSLNPLGRPFMTSVNSEEAAVGLDYALFQVSSADHKLENIIKLGTDDQSIASVQRVVTSELHDVEILAATSRGIIKGYISGTPAFSSAPGHRSFNKLFRVSLDKPLYRGDCGTWIIDANCGDLYGHIVAGSPGDDVAFVAPFADIFKDIHVRLGQPPFLPTARTGSIGTTAIDIPVDTQVQSEDITGMTQSEGLSRHATTTEGAALNQSGTNITTLTVAYEHEGAILATHTALIRAGLFSQVSIEVWSEGLCKDFGRFLAEKRLDDLEKRRCNPRNSEDGTERGSQEIMDPKGKKTTASFFSLRPPSEGTSLRNFPLVPSAPAPGDLIAQEFRDRLFKVSEIPMKWEDPGLLEKALQDIDLGRIYAEAEEESNDFIALAYSMDDGRKPVWGYQDCVIRALSRYFDDFFFCIHAHSCIFCNSDCRPLNNSRTQPTPEERAQGAHEVDLWVCLNPTCSASFRIPLCWDTWTLLRTRRGGSPEWANCFGMLCRAVGSRARYVWSPEGFSGTEVYSEHQERWVHVDAGHELWDNPLRYTDSWGVRMSYCIAFSVDGATDVTRRYVRDSDHSLSRTACSEEVLMHILQAIRAQRRKTNTKEEKLRMDSEDSAEAMELLAGIVTRLTLEVSRLSIPGRSYSGESSTAANRSWLLELPYSVLVDSEDSDSESDLESDVESSGSESALLPKHKTGASLASDVDCVDARAKGKQPATDDTGLWAKGKQPRTDDGGLQDSSAESR